LARRGRLCSQSLFGSSAGHHRDIALLQQHAGGVEEAMCSVIWPFFTVQRMEHGTHGVRWADPASEPKIPKPDHLWRYHFGREAGEVVGENNSAVYSFIRHCPCACRRSEEFAGAVAFHTHRDSTPGTAAPDCHLDAASTDSIKLLLASSSVINDRPHECDERRPGWMEQYQL
jgi:hypothetical protein